MLSVLSWDYLKKKIVFGTEKKNYTQQIKYIEKIVSILVHKSYYYLKMYNYSIAIT